MINKKLKYNCIKNAIIFYYQNTPINFKMTDITIEKFKKNIHEILPEDFDESLQMIARMVDYSNCDELAKTIIEYFMNGGRWHGNEQLIEIIQHIYTKYPKTINIIDNYQLRIYHYFSYHENYKLLWLKYFPVKSEVIISIIEEETEYTSCYFYMDRLANIFPLRDMLGDKYFDVICNKILYIVDFIYKRDFCSNEYYRLNSMIMDSDLSKNECVEIANKFENPNTLGGWAKCLPMVLLRLKHYDFESENSPQFSQYKYPKYNYLKDGKLDFDGYIDYIMKSAFDWCIRQYFHNLNPTIIWKFILTNEYFHHPITYDTIIYYNHMKQYLCEDIATNIILLCELITICILTDYDAGLSHEIYDTFENNMKKIDIKMY